MKENTQYAPAERASDLDIKRQKSIFQDEDVLNKYLDAVPEVFLILNEQRQIVYSNSAISSILPLRPEDILGKRPGEAIGCIHANEENGGCGTSVFCSTCGAVNAILNSLGGSKDVQECRILLSNNSEALDLRVWTTPIFVNDEKFVVFTIQDISSEKRKGQLEKIFFHDILNALGGLKGIAEILDKSDENEFNYFKELILKVSNQVIDEIQAQKQLMLAENGDLKSFFDTYFTNQIVNYVADSYRFHTVAEGKEILVETLDEELPFDTDATILKRVVGNMLKNALEASKEGEIVIVGVRINNSDNIEFYVKNPGYMPETAQLQVFQRSFSTKGEGRGLGTYSIKFLTEKYLNGKAHFSSNEDSGTEFFVEIPKKG